MECWRLDGSCRRDVEWGITEAKARTTNAFIQPPEVEAAVGFVSRHVLGGSEARRLGLGVCLTLRRLSNHAMCLFQSS
jgi:hypothetical protein